MTRPDFIARFRQLRAADRRVLLLVLLLLPLVHLSLRAVGLTRTVSLLSRFGHDHRITHSNEWNPRAWHIMRLMHVAARRGFVHGTCLSQSLTLWALLRHAGITSELRIGVRKVEGNFLAHAWIELAGFPLNDGVEVVSHYAAFETLPIPNWVKWA